MHGAALTRHTAGLREKKLVKYVLALKTFPWEWYPSLLLMFHWPKQVLWSHLTSCGWGSRVFTCAQKKREYSYMPRKKESCGASLVAQWLRICLPMQGTRVRALVWEDPTCHGATKPMCHNYWACASGACAPQQERPREWEACTLRWRVAPACRNWRKPSHRNEDPTQPKINK